MIMTPAYAGLHVTRQDDDGGVRWTLRGVTGAGRLNRPAGDRERRRRLLEIPETGGWAEERGLVQAYQVWDTARMTASQPKGVVWVASSRKDLRDFPDEVRQVMGCALYLGQSGDKYVSTKALHGFGGALR